MKIYAWISASEEAVSEKDLLQLIDEGEGIFYLSLRELMLERSSEDGFILVLESVDFGKISTNPKFVSSKQSTLKNKK